jgi:hypothetical protein
MADTIPGRQTINVGVQNQATGSDDLYTAFTKVETNFENLFTNASPYLNVSGSTGILVTNPSSNSVSITNTGVTKLTSGTGITLDSSNGNITISVSGDLTGVVAGVTNVNIKSTTLNVSGSPIISRGNIGIELPALATGANFNPGTYVSPTLTVDGYGRIVEISNISSAGTVTKIAVSSGEGIGISGSPIIDSGTINIVNTGVTKLTAGQGILLSGSNGAITISGANPPTSGVSRIDFTSNTLSIAGSPVTSSGTVNIELPTNATFTKITSANLVSTGPVYATANIYGANANLGNLVTANYTTAVLTTNAQPNITSVGSLTSLTVTGNIGSGNASLGNLVTANFVTINNNANVTANLKAGNANIVTTLTAGNITTTNGIFWANGAPYSPPAPNILMTNITANTAIATTTAVPLGLDNLSYVGDVLIFNNVAIDTESAYSTSTGKYTPTVAGYYEFSASFSPTIVSLGTNASAVQDGTNYVIMLVKNGTVIVAAGQQIGGMNLGAGGFAWSGFTQSSINVMVPMNGSTDYVQVFLVATIKSGSFTNGNTMSNYLQAIWLRP